MQSIPASLRAKASAKRTAIVVRPKSRSALLLGIALLLTFVMNTVSACAPLTQTVLDSIVLGTYPATAEDVRAAEAAYAAKEKELKEEIDSSAIPAMTNTILQRQTFGTILMR